MTSFIINVVTAGIAPAVLGIYLVGLAGGRIKAKDEAQREKVQKNRTALTIIGWLAMVGGLGGILFEVLALLQA